MLAAIWEQGIVAAYSYWRTGDVFPPDALLAALRPSLLDVTCFDAELGNIIRSMRRTRFSDTPSARATSAVVGNGVSISVCAICNSIVARSGRCALGIALSPRQSQQRHAPRPVRPIIQSQRTAVRFRNLPA